MKAIGIDIGGTSIKGIVIDQSGRIAGETNQATDAAKGKDCILANVKDVIRQLLEQHPDSEGIGIGTAGRVNASTGEIVYATDNLPGWQGSNLKEEIESVFHRRVSVDNDANTALIGECWLGAGAGCCDVTMLTLGTGVGGANRIGGKIVRGAQWNGGEWGHVILVPNGRPCNCGQRGCIEQYISGTAFVQAAAEAASIHFPSGVEVLEAYEKGNPAVAAVLNQFIDDLTVVIHNIHLGINPQAILIGGGMVDSKSIWWGLLEERVKRQRLHISIRAAELGNQAGSIGAARMVWDARL
ncbi:ROK family protein [Paenibacillus apiarius]|uniref:ROK family protein n=1 Tax=Paenibacillus apiarius TaxID=46240 RepID=UPI00197FE40F|nr:ROK family protein [Paenibacillus apiarius]MBN3523308.1 ROK family protein [Paenibacillus apiarius]